MTLVEIAARISAHLQRFERDPKINVDNPATKLRRLYHPRAWHGGRFVRVRYIAFQGIHSLTREQATQYLARLDAGFIGRHTEAP